MSAHRNQLFLLWVLGSHCWPLSMVWAELEKIAWGRGIREEGGIALQAQILKSREGNAQAGGGTKTPAPRLLASGSL